MMSIKYSKRFSEARPANFDGIFDWDFLLPAFAGTRIQPTDIDGMVERYGRFLLFETKQPGKHLEQGQVIALENLILLGKGRIMLMILYGKNPDEIHNMEIWLYSNDKVMKIERECTAEIVVEHVRGWFNKANEYGKKGQR
jgi:hypothetical protein